MTMPPQQNSRPSDSSGAYKIKVAISACLLGHNVRYDGKDKFALQNIDDKTLSLIEWVEICPEVYMGQDVPREPIKLYKNNHQKLELKTLNTQINLTKEATAKFKELIAENKDIKHWVLKSKSPSCGLGTTKIQLNGQPNKEVIGDGLFMTLLKQTLLNAKFTDEATLASPEQLIKFINN